MVVLHKLPKTDIASSPTACCAEISPEEWSNKEYSLDNKKFVKVRTRSIARIPINIGKVFADASKKIEAANADTDEKLTLTAELTPWHAYHYIAVSDVVPGLDNVELPGRFITKVFNGPYRLAPVWKRELEKYARSKHLDVVDIYLYYTDCPSCSKFYGTNYVVGFAHVNEER